jgi:hypothetical protein
MPRMQRTKPAIVIIRTRDAGVHVGELVSRNGNEVTLNGPHKIWRWRGANTAPAPATAPATAPARSVNRYLPT